MSPATRLGRWRSLDGTTLFRYAVAVSELHEGVLHDLLTTRLGLAWTAHPRRHSLVARHEIDGVPVEVTEAFSSRSRAIGAAKDVLVADFVARRGRHPSSVEALKLRQQATLATRPDKQHRTLAELMTRWRSQAQPLLPPEISGWARGLLGRAYLPQLTSNTINDEMQAEIARVALETVAAKRATFGHANVLAEAHRQLHGARFAAPEDRLELPSA